MHARFDLIMKSRNYVNPKYFPFLTIHIKFIGVSSFEYYFFLVGYRVKCPSNAAMFSSLSLNIFDLQTHLFFLKVEMIFFDFLLSNSHVSALQINLFGNKEHMIHESV